MKDQLARDAIYDLTNKIIGLEYTINRKIAELNFEAEKVCELSASVKAIVNYLGLEWREEEKIPGRYVKKGKR